MASGVAVAERPERMAWLSRLPERVSALVARWSLVLDAPFTEQGSCSWVAPARLPDGSAAVLKFGMPHMEAEQEIAGLRYWAGDPSVHLLDADEHFNALLIERCVPGTSLRELAEPDQDVVVAQLLGKLWKRPLAPHPFRNLSVMTAHWIAESWLQAAHWQDPSLTRAGLALLETLAVPAPSDVLLATDLHAGNVLAAERLPWLVIDPKPFVGDRHYDATQHLFNCPQRMSADPHGTIRRMADLLSIDATRLRLWMFARLAAEPREDWTSSQDTARALAP